ncbi:MAG: hypothetical protein J1E01_00655 [Acetatifactor sp.]|nr:hypothetical protein [Acetatifactor sp.]
MFSYAEYGNIIMLIKESGKQATFRKALTVDSYIIMRHDVEFSVERAYDLACFEAENKFQSTYFFQVTNNAYNLLAKKNIDMLEKIKHMGHEVGLHFHLNGLEQIDEIKREIQKEVEIMNCKLSFSVDSFSIHRPTALVLSGNIKIPGLINAYQKEFFSYVADMEKEKPDVKYLSDARHQWNYGLLPDKETLFQNKKIQILTHPYTWTQTGYNNANNFKTLYAEKCQVLLETFDSECKHFKEIKNEL